MGNPFMWVELHTQDPEAARRFYTSLFSWQLKDVPMGPGATYTMIDVGGGTGGGMLKHPVPGAPAQWLAYVRVDDVAAATRKAQDLGARVLRPRSEVPGFGWLSVIADPTGGALGLWEAKT